MANDCSKKYLRNKMLTQVELGPRTPHFWAIRMKVKNKFIKLGYFIVGGGSQVRFWEDNWLGQQSFKTRFPNLYNIARRKNATVQSVLLYVPLNMSF